MSAGYPDQSLFSDQTLNAVPRAISNAGMFFVTEDFNLWKEFCGSSVSAFVEQYNTLRFILLSLWRGVNPLMLITVLPTRLIVYLVLMSEVECQESVVPSPTEKLRSQVIAKEVPVQAQAGGNLVVLPVSQSRRDPRIMTRMPFIVSVSDDGLLV